MNYDRRIIFDSKEQHKLELLQKILNKILNKFKVKVQVSTLLNNGTDMVATNQRLNFFHLLNRVLQTGVQGEIVELGCFDGQIATMFQHINDQNKAGRKIFLFDNFRNDFGLNENIKDRLIYNFTLRNLTVPEIIEGDFKDTLSQKLPAKICFAHIDCGIGKDPKKHKQIILHCLENIYPRLEPGGICVLMDYHDHERTIEGINSNPGVKPACDEFFRDKQEEVFILYGGAYSHGYFIKGFRLPS
jgi:O-methyltransferase